MLFIPLLDLFVASSECLVCFLVCPQVTSHKTNEAFGPAQIVLTEEEIQEGTEILPVERQAARRGQCKVFVFHLHAEPLQKLK